MYGFKGPAALWQRDMDYSVCFFFICSLCESTQLTHPIIYPITIYSSSPKKTLTPSGRKVPSQTLKRSGMAEIFLISSSVRDQSSRSKLALMRPSETDLGMTLVSRARPHWSRTCWGVRPLALAISRRVVLV